MGLREKKKERIRQEIMAQAKVLFDEKGYEETSIADIASRCEIAVGTVYNYYQSKPEIYIAVMTGVYDRDQDVNFYHQIEAQDDLPDMVMAFAVKYLEPVLKMDERIIMSMLRAMLSTDLKSPIMQSLLKIDVGILKKLEQAFDLKKGQGKLPQGFPSLLHAENLYSIIGCEVLYSMIDTTRDPQKLYQRIEQKVRLYFKPIASESR